MASGRCTKALESRPRKGPIEGTWRAPGPVNRFTGPNSAGRRVAPACSVRPSSCGYSRRRFGRDEPSQQGPGRVRMVRGEQTRPGPARSRGRAPRAPTGAAPSRRRGRSTPPSSTPCRPSACRSTPPEPTSSRTCRRSIADTRGDRTVAPDVRAGSPRACRRSAMVAASRASRLHRPRRSASVCGMRPGFAGPRLARPPRSASASAAVSRRSATAAASTDGRAPAQAQVALDGPAAPQGAGDVGRRVRVGLAHASRRRWWRRRRRPRAGPRRAWSASSSTAVSTTSGVAPRTSEANRGPRDSRLPPMTWRRNTSRIAARAGPGFSTPMRGSTLSVATAGTPAAGQRRPPPRRGRRRCRRRTTGTRSRAVGEPGRVVPQHVRVAAVGAADEQHHVGPVRSQRGDAGPVEPAGGDVHDPRAGRQADPVPGLGRHQRLVPDHGEPQPAAGRRADVRLGHVRPGLADGPLDRRVQAVQHVGVHCGRVRGRRQQRRRCRGRPRPPW